MEESNQQRDESDTRIKTMLPELSDAAIDRLEEELATSTKRLDEAMLLREKLEADVSESHEADEKLPAYENSRLFKHLHGRQFGTPNYTRRGITRALDRGVARRINYSRARQSYDFLSSVPDLMKAEVERRHQTRT